MLGVLAACQLLAATWPALAHATSQFSSLRPVIPSWPAPVCKGEHHRKHANTSITGTRHFRDLVNESQIEIVVSRLEDNVTWVTQLNATTTIYNDLDSTTFPLSERQAADLKAVRGNTRINVRPIPNMGDEAQAYLRYIVDRYDNLPDIVVFLNGRRYDPDNHKKDMLKTLACMRFPKEFRFHNINDEKHPECFGIGLPSMPGHVGVTTEEHIEKLQNIPPSLKAEFGLVDDLPIWCTHCCGQFVVDKRAILDHPKDFYKDLLAASITGDEDFKYAMEYMWLAILDPNQGRRSISTHLTMVTLRWCSQHVMSLALVGLLLVVIVVVASRRQLPQKCLLRS